MGSNEFPNWAYHHIAPPPHFKFRSAWPGYLHEREMMK